MSATQMKISPIAYADTGSGEPVVMIHCSSSSAREWQSLCETLNADFRSIAVDQWGCGNSAPWGGQVAFTLASEAAPIVNVIREIGTPVHLVGHSYGGGVALKIAREHPELVLSLTLIEPSCFHLLAGDPQDVELLSEITTLANAVIDAVSSGNYWEGTEQFVDYWSGAGTWAAMPQKLKMRLCQTLDKVILDFRALFNEPTELGDYANITCPGLVLCGEYARGPNRRIAEILGDALPRVTLQMIPRAGHMSPVTHPEVVNGAILDHLYRNSVTEPQVRVA
jgi:pimeloyl-ACP methyl ester carboxylesterase